MTRRNFVWTVFGALTATKVDIATKAIAEVVPEVICSGIQWSRIDSMMLAVQAEMDAEFFACVEHILAES